MTFEHGAALGTALAALFAIWLAERRSRFDARRAFVEFTLGQRTKVGAELIAALTTRAEVVHAACFWNEQVARNQNVAVATREFNRALNETLPHSLTRVNDALAAAGLAFSQNVIDRANELIVMFNDVMVQTPLPVFDRPAALALLGRVTAALRDEMRFPDVLRYQERLFEPTWWERLSGR